MLSHAFATVKTGGQRIDNTRERDGIGDRSASKAATAWGVGDNPVKSNVARRINIRRSARGATANPAGIRIAISDSIEAVSYRRGTAW